MLGQSTVIVAPTSTSVLDASYRPRISIGDETTRVLVEKLSSVDLGRLGEQQGRVSGGERDAIDDALKLVLDLA
jgi:mRNA-degrading endonuclease toxin of MazEF toxin-antitoxin module